MILHVSIFFELLKRKALKVMWVKRQYLNVVMMLNY